MTVSPSLSQTRKTQSSGLIIYPYHGVGLIRFGMMREDVRGLLGKPSATFYKGLSTESSTDAYDDLGLHVYYNHPSGCCEALSLFSQTR